LTTTENVLYLGIKSKRGAMMLETILKQIEDQKKIVNVRIEVPMNFGQYDIKITVSKN